MSVKVNGMDKMVAEIENRLGKSKMNEISGQAVKKGGEHILKANKSNFDSVKDTGASRDEMKITETVTEEGKTKANIHWSGPDNRYRIIHLIEWGTIKKPNPKGKGTNARTLQSEKSAYGKIIADTLKRGV